MNTPAAEDEGKEGMTGDTNSCGCAAPAPVSGPGFWKSGGWMLAERVEEAAKGLGPSSRW